MNIPTDNRVNRIGFVIILGINFNTMSVRITQIKIENVGNTMTFRLHCNKIRYSQPPIFIADSQNIDVSLECRRQYDAFWLIYLNFLSKGNEMYLSDNGRYLSLLIRINSGNAGGVTMNISGHIATDSLLLHIPRLTSVKKPDGYSRQVFVFQSCYAARRGSCATGRSTAAGSSNCSRTHSTACPTTSP